MSHLSTYYGNEFRIVPDALSQLEGLYAYDETNRMLPSSDFQQQIN